MPQSHSPEFLRLRDAVLAMEDEERRRLTVLFGCMHGQLPPPGPRVVDVLRMFVELDPSERERVMRWFGTYCSRWGQIPQAASRKVPTPTAGSSVAGVDRSRGT